MATTCLTASLLVLAATNLASQVQLEFEVASIKPAPPVTMESMRSGQLHVGVKIDAARADFGSVSLASLISRAYRVRSFQVTGPDWLNSEKFDILAKLPDGASPDQVPEMLQALLAERFKLTLHRDTKEFPVYALVVGKDGPKLTARPADYDPATKAKSNIRPMTLDAFAELISGLADRPILNRTELQGEYMLSLQEVMGATIKRLSARAAARTAAASGSPAADAASEPDGSAAVGIVQTLGLKLEPRKLPLPLLVVDHLEKTPTGD